MKKSFSDIPLILGVIVLISSCFINGCAPTLAWYFKAHRLPAVSRCSEPLLPMTLAVADFRDDRPGNEKVNVGEAAFDIAATGLSFGLGALFRVDEDNRPQPFTRVDKDVPDYIAIILRNANLFSSVKRTSGGCEIYSNPTKITTWHQANTEDLILVGSIYHLWGKWQTGRMLSQTGSSDYQFKYTYRKYELFGAGGNISLSLKLIRASNGDVYWEHNFDVYEPHVGDLQLCGQFTQNDLAAAAFYKSLGDVAEELRLYLETHPNNIETASK